MGVCDYVKIKSGRYRKALGVVDHEYTRRRYH